VPAGSFTMGAPPNEPERANNETQVRVSIVARFAVGRYAVTFDEWDACVADGGRNGHKPSDQRGCRGKHPEVNVNWDDAKAYGVAVTRNRQNLPASVRGRVRVRLMSAAGAPAEGRGVPTRLRRRQRLEGGEGALHHLGNALALNSLQAHIRLDAAMHAARTARKKLARSS